MKIQFWNGSIEVLIDKYGLTATILIIRKCINNVDSIKIKYKLLKYWKSSKNVNFTIFDTILSLKSKIQIDLQLFCQLKNIMFDIKQFTKF